MIRFPLVSILAFASMAAPASATIVATSYQVGYLVSPPPSVLPGALINDSFLLMFQERKGLTLTAPLAVDITLPNIVYSAKSQITGATIPSGTVINSYYIHGNVDMSKVKFASQYVSFSSEEQVIGIMVLASSLEHGNPVVGSPTTLYQTNAAGIGLHFPPAGNDDIGFTVATTANPVNTVTFNETVRGTYVTDIRIITQVVPTGTVAPHPPRPAK